MDFSAEHDAPAGALPAPTVLDRVLAIGQLLQRDMERSFAGTGLSTARTHLLWVLHHAGPSTQSTLAAALEVSPRNITGLVDALEKTGHVVRGEHPTDRRATLVALTDSGTRIMHDMAADHVELSQQLVDGLPSDEVDVLLRGLEHIETVLERLIVAAEQEAGAP